MKTAFKDGARVRANGGDEVGTIVRYDCEGFYIVDVERFGISRRLVVHEDDIETAEEDG